MKVFLLFIILFTGSICIAQSRHGSQWIIGQTGNVRMDFNSSPVDIFNYMNPSNHTSAGSNISMSNSLGQLLFYSNGCEVRNRFDEIMTNGDTINPGITEEFYCANAADNGNSPIPQGVLSLPFVDDPHKYYLLNLDLEITTHSDTYTTLDPKRLYYSIIDMELDNGLGAVISKQNILLEDTLALASGQLTAAKHANGSDWWIVSPKAVSNCYYTILLTSNGFETSTLQCTGQPWNYSHNVGQAVFSYDGTKYARFNPRNGLHIFDFDRCDGQLSNPVMIPFPEDSFSVAGLSISPNSRFLYAAARTKLYQYDLWSSDIPNSQILIDTLDIVNAPPLSAVFFLSQLAPDNKIYIAGTSSHQFLHVINEPNILGKVCDFRQQAVELPALNFVSIPNFPNYNLEAVSEPCTTSTSTSLSQKNNIRFNVFPNPATNVISINFDKEKFEHPNISISLFNLSGKPILTRVSANANTDIDVSNLPSGFYFYKISHLDKIFQTDKLTIIR